ncbi:TEL2, telomere maintenance protein 2 [Entomortierella lignicola]|nr:TEL2, telomere maintenance protein 2 [Entomortierella lignicola]
MAHHRGEVSKDKQLAASKDQELQLAKIHRAAKILVAIGFGTTDDGRDSDTKGDGFNNNALVEHVLFQGRVYDIGVLRMLICVQSGWPSNAQTGKDSVLTMTFKRALEIWSDSMLVNHASADYQRYVSYQILLMTGYFGEKDAIDSDLISIFYKGMPYWLELENPQRRQLGMVIAEEISLVVDPTGKPADFELEETDNIRFARSLVLLKDGCKPYNPEALISTDSSNGLDEGDLGENVDSQDSKVDEMHESDDEEDPDAIVDQFSRATLHDDSDSDSDDDVADDDDVKPYAMEYESDPDEDVGASNKPKVAAPLYLRDLLSYLRASEDREKFEVGLQNAAELIRRKVGSLELEEHAEQLTAAMAVLGDYFDTKNFYKMRENTLVALVVTSPVIASGVLTLEFYEKKNSVGQRLNILTALVLGAREISGFDRSPSTNASSSSASAQSSSGQLSRSKHATSSSVYSTSSALSSTSTLVGPTSSHPPPPPATFDNITSNISLAKTRRFSQKSNIEASRPAPKANAFSNVAPVFLGGLLGRWGGNRGAGMERGYDALQKAPVMVMKKFVITLGVLVYFAGNSPHLISITRELFRFLFALRYHNPPSQPSPGNVTPGQPMTTGSGFVNPTLTSLKLPGEIEISTGMSSRSDNSTSTLAPRILNTLPYNPEMLESILYDLLILLTPSPGAMSDQLLMDEFFVEVMECHAWTIELWGMFKMEEESDNKARMYCAALVQRCHELLEVK